MRQFQSASGRTWAVDLASTTQATGVNASVLRFWSPGLTCDLADWPEDWERLPDPKLITLLDRALTEWVATSRT